MRLDKATHSFGLDVWGCCKRHKENDRQAQTWLAKGKPNNDSRKSLKSLISATLEKIQAMPPDDIKTQNALAVFMDIAQRKCGFGFNETAAATQ